MELIEWRVRVKYLHIFTFRYVVGKCVGNARCAENTWCLVRGKQKNKGIQQGAIKSQVHFTW